uniref:Secreted protein n=1 Tax=Steinernema glaseri TaxID=37863 RepID=A0A1I7ZZ83_9BILA
MNSPAGTAKPKRKNRSTLRLICALFVSNLYDCQMTLKRRTWTVLKMILADWFAAPENSNSSQILIVGKA